MSTAANTPKTTAATAVTTRTVNYSALQYLLNETVAHSIKSTIAKSKNTQKEDIDNYISNIDHMNAPSTLSYINQIGFNVGYKTAQTLLLDPNSSTTTISNMSNTALIDNPLEAMKFICRDVWKNIFGKQMDNLRTNHAGTFVLVDNKPISYGNCYFVPSSNMQDTVSRAPAYIEFNAGLIHGVLASLGVSVVAVTVSPNTEINKDNSSNGVMYTVETKTE